MLGASTILLGLAMSASGGCPTHVLLEGDPSVIERLRPWLIERGILPDAVEGCGGPSVQLDASGSALALRISTDGRAGVDRRARDAIEAATIIESWAREDVTEPLLTRSIPALPKPRAVLQSAREDDPAGDAPSQPRTPAPLSFAVSAGAVVGVGSDASTWSGVDLRGCLDLWVLCLGGRLQYSVDLLRSGTAVRWGAERAALDLSATAELPISVGPVELTPGLGIGQGLVFAERDFGPVEVKEDAGGLRVRAQLGASWRLSGRWALRLDAALDLAPFARQELLANRSDPIPEVIRLPGEPSAIGWVRLAVELGGIR
ncbi:MAG: hypothetical protein IT384_04225 [Deltaproteobacteria bacterium]|nr:hypothetical protein [Deltaproteobacteria bacterium]